MLGKFRIYISSVLVHISKICHLCVHTHVLGSCRLSEGVTTPPSPGHTAAFGSLLGPASGRTSRLKGCSASFPPPTLQSHPGFNRGILELEPETQAGDLSVALVWEFPAPAVVRTACVHAQGPGPSPWSGTKILVSAHGMADSGCHPGAFL